MVKLKNGLHLKSAQGTAMHYTIINNLLKIDKIKSIWLFLVSLLWVLTSFWSLSKSSTIKDLKRENEGLKRQIEVCYEQKDRLDNDVRACIEFEQDLDKYCTCNFIDPVAAAQGK